MKKMQCPIRIQKNQKNFYPVLIAFVVFFILNSVAEVDVAFQPSENWYSEIVDDSGWVGIDSSIGVDANNNPHISHYDQGNRDLKYAYWDGSSWQNEIVDSEGDVGERSGITIDDNGNPHISYLDATNGYLKYAKWTGDSWDIKIVDQAYEYYTMSTSIALDTNDYPHIAYNMESTGDNPTIVKYAYWGGSSWNIENVSVRGIDICLALDSNDTAHITFVKSVSVDVSRIHHAKKTSGVWNIEVVDSSTLAGGDSGIAIDSNNHTHIAFRDYGNDTIRYAKWNGTSWDIQTVVTGVGEEEGLGMALDSQDRPHIIYSYVNEQEEAILEYAMWNSSLWTVEVVDKMGIPRIAVDNLDRPHVSHNYNMEDGMEILKYSFRYGLTSTTTTISGECIKGDSDCDGTVSDFELLSYIDTWVIGEATDFELLAAIDAWANG